MRRRAMLALAFAAPSVVSYVAYAQSTVKPAPAAAALGGAPVASAASSASAPGASVAASTSAAGSTPATASAPSGGVVPPSGPAAAPPAAGTPVLGKGLLDGATYAVRLRDLETRVDDLKEQIRRSQTRLALLSDAIVAGGVAGSRADIGFRNELGSSFRLSKATFLIDGAIAFSREDATGQLAEVKELSVYNASIPPGDHTVNVALTYRGNGYGFFTYLNEYRFEVKGTRSFTVPEGKALQVTVRAYERGDATTNLGDRPALEWKESLTVLGGGAVSSGAPGAAGGGAPAAAPSPAGAAPGGNAPPASVSGGVTIGGGSK